MRRYLIALSALALFLAGCGGMRSGRVVDAVAADSVAAADSASVEVVEAVDEEMDGAAMPAAADELFDDFIFNFAANRRLQRERVAFPLRSVGGERTEVIERGQWKTEHFFLRQQYYTLLFDSEEAMEAVKDTSICEATVEKIFFDSQRVTQYVFNRLRGVWMLTELRSIGIGASANASFLDFYHRFATDKEFQAQSLGETVTFVGPDPDDDFSRMEGVITADTWEAFAPELPGRMIYNIIYGAARPEGDTKIFVLRGIANGLEMEMTFRRGRDGRWKLTKLNT